MKRAFIFPIFVAVSLLATPIHLMAAVGSGSLIKASGPAVYYLHDGKRYVFANEKVYFSWYADFDSVATVSDEELASYLLGGNITYRPASKLVKIQSDPKVYAVSPGGTLRWIASETAARTLYGADWNRKIDDIPDAFFLNYKEGDSVTAPEDFDLDAARKVASISDDLGARAGAPVPETVVATKSGTWQDKNTWGGKKPMSGGQVVIPAGIKVTYDAAASGNLRSLKIDGKLEFLNTESRKLSSRLIEIGFDGSLAVGYSEVPWPAALEAVIELTAAGTGADAGEGLRVSGGTLDLHGASVGTAWTRLAAPAAKGDSSVFPERPVVWPVGAEVAIASTSLNQDEVEVRTIVEMHGGVIMLDRPLEHDHAAEGPLTAEVALLTRNVSVKGAGNGQGSAVIVTRGKVRVSNAQLNGLGRSGVTGHHPLSFDGLTDASASYVKQSVVRASGNRCVSLRQTGMLLVEDTVGFDIVGHCFATEDGTETKSVFRNDLAIRVRKNQARPDETPAAFRLRNPDNVVEGSVAAGSEGHGFWYDLPGETTRLDGLKIRPRETALGLFKDNTAHSAAMSGLYIDDAAGKTNYAPSAKAVFSGYRGSRNGDYGFRLRGSNFEVIGGTLADNRVGGSFSAFGAAFRDSTVLGNLESASNTPSGRFGFIYEDGPVTVSGVTFRNFVASASKPSAAFGFKERNDRAPDPRSSFRNVSFVNARRWQAADPTAAGDQMSAVRDTDASRTITTRSGYLDNGCAADAAGNVQSCPGAYVVLTIAMRDIGSAKAVAVERAESGAAVTLKAGSSFDGIYAYATVIEGKTYRLRTGYAREFALDYDGLAEPLTVRFEASFDADVKDGLDRYPKVELPALVPGTWAYDLAKNEAVVMLSPGGSASVSW
jgi:hypothetical protein